MKDIYRFPRGHRLVNKAEFKSLFDLSQKVTQRHLLALYKPNQKDHARLGIIVSKRVSKLAVTRNTIKRIVRESFRTHAVSRQGFDIIVIARQPCGQLNKVQLREGIDKLWQKLALAICSQAASA